MGTWTYVLWGVGAVMALGPLLKIMLVRRNQVVVEWQTQAAAEKKKQKKAKP